MASIVVQLCTRGVLQLQRPRALLSWLDPSPLELPVTGRKVLYHRTSTVSGVYHSPDFII